MLEAVARTLVHSRSFWMAGVFGGTMLTLLINQRVAHAILVFGLAALVLSTNVERRTAATSVQP